MNTKVITIMSAGAWQFGEWQILGETSSPSEEVWIPSMTEAILEDHPKATITQLSSPSTA
jgi:hypothetical protein